MFNIESLKLKVPMVHVPGQCKDFKWVTHSRHGVRFATGDDRFVEHTDTLVHARICSVCGCLAPGMAMDLVKYGWRPVISRAIHMSSDPPEAYKTLAETIMGLKDGETEWHDVGLLLEPATGAHPFLVRRQHFSDSNWGSLLAVEALSDDYPNSKDDYAS